MDKHLNVSHDTSTSKLEHKTTIPFLFGITKTITCSSLKKLLYFVLLWSELFGIKSQHYDKARNLRSYCKKHDSKMMNL